MIQGVFFDWPPYKLLEYGNWPPLNTNLAKSQTRPPSTQKFCKVPDWPPLNTKIILSVELILYQKQSRTLHNFCVKGGRVWDLAKFVLRGG